MHVHNGQFKGLRGALAASIVVLLAAAPALAAEDAQPAASGYVPTAADYLAVYEPLQRYRLGVQKHDEALERSAFWEDSRGRGGGGGGRNGGPPPGGQPGANAGPPPGANGGPPAANAGPPPGANAGRPSFEDLKKMPGFVEVWHLPLDSYIHFESATRARHYEYFLSTYPQPEKKVDDLASLPNASSYRTSILGWPGHYDDILEKRNGEWRILQRKMGMNTK